MKMELGIKGLFRIDAVDSITGKKRELAPWQNNQLLNTGTNAMGLVDNWMNYCQVGNDATPPDANQSGLGSWVAGTNVKQNDINGAQGTEPWYGWRRITYRFGIGEAAGNLSEMGIGWAVDGSTLISRQLVRNQAGTPITIEVLPTEYLDVTYELRYYPPLLDVDAQHTIGGVVYETRTRASAVNTDQWSKNIGREMTAYAIFDSDWQAYDGAIGSLTEAPSGAAAACDNSNAYGQTYQGNSRQRTVGINCGSTGWNLGAGIRSLRIKTMAGSYQTQFGANGDLQAGPTIPKTTLDTMQMNWTFGWTVKALP